MPQVLPFGAPVTKKRRLSGSRQAACVAMDNSRRKRTPKELPGDHDLVNLLLRPPFSQAAVCHEGSLCWQRGSYPSSGGIEKKTGGAQNGTIPRSETKLCVSLAAPDHAQIRKVPLLLSTPTWSTRRIDRCAMQTKKKSPPYFCHTSKYIDYP